MSDKVYKGDIGTAIILDTDEDLAGASGFAIKYKKPSGRTGSWVAAPTETTKIAYVTQAGDLDEAGCWTLQGYAVDVGGTWTGHGLAVTFDVYNLFG